MSLTRSLVFCVAQRSEWILMSLARFQYLKMSKAWNFFARAFGAREIVVTIYRETHSKNTAFVSPCIWRYVFWALLSVPSEFWRFFARFRHLKNVKNPKSTYEAGCSRYWLQLYLSFVIFYQVLKHLDFTFVSYSEQKLWMATLSVFKSR